MGFFDSYQDEGGEGGGVYVTKAEKADIIENATPFAISAVEFQAGQGYKGADRYLLTISLNGEERKLSFGTGTVDSRDRMLSAMAEFLAENEGATVDVTIEEAGAAQLLVPA